MVHSFITKLIQITYLLPLTFVSAFLFPFPVMAESNTQFCTDAQKQTEQTQNVLRPLEQHQEQLQQHVRSIYQELFTCQTDWSTSLAQQQHCTQLQEEGRKQFQAMVEAITKAHQMPQQLVRQTKQAQLTCPAIIEKTFPKIARLGHS